MRDFNAAFYRFVKVSFRKVICIIYSNLAQTPVYFLQLFSQIATRFACGEHKCATLCIFGIS